MKRHILLALVALTGILLAEIKIKPDENTLWLEDGKNIVTSEKVGKGWLGNADGSGEKKLKITPRAEKGFDFCATDGSGKKTHRYVPRNPEYKYLVIDIEDLEMYPGIYHNWTLQMDNAGIVWGQAGALNPGIYIFDLFAGRQKEKANQKQDNLFIYVYGSTLHFNEIKMVKKPDVMIEVKEKNGKNSFTIGDTLVFTVTLKEEAEDVSLRLFNSGLPSPLTINDLQKIQLKPTDDTQLVWTTELEVKEFGISEKQYNKHDRIMIKATLLGGATDRPVWTTIPMSFSK